MSKQVRLRRGTTIQHAAFTGADGEVTVDTSKRCLVVHDGVTAGGKPVDGWLKLDPGNPVVVQEVKSGVKISGGDAGTIALFVEHPVVVNDFTANGGAEVCRLAMMQGDLVYAPTVNLDFRDFGTLRLALTGNVTFTTSNVGFGRGLLVRLAADASPRTLAFPAGWKFVGGAAPASIAANKTGLLRLWCFGMTNADVVAHWLVES